MIEVINLIVNAITLLQIIFLTYHKIESICRPARYTVPQQVERIDEMVTEIKRHVEKIALTQELLHQ